MKKEFEEVAHTGGKVTFTVRTDAEGRRSYQIRVSNSAPRPAGLFAIYSLPQGIPVGTIHMAGLGVPWNPPPTPDCYAVFLATDSEGLFGHECPRCNGYWRSDGMPRVCPYCGTVGEAHEFLTQAQTEYVGQYMRFLGEALEAPEDGEHVIDMDKVTNAIGKDGPKPPFYYSGERQQTLLRCGSCKALADILGRYGYCSRCGTRNDLQVFETDMSRLRDRINSDGPLNDCVRDAVALFDSSAGKYVGQLAKRVPMTPRRKARLDRMRFHDLGATAEALGAAFDIDVLDGLALDDQAFAKRMFFRRHVYEHGGGEVDEKYLRDSGDTSVRLKQVLSETQESAHRLVNLLVKMQRNLHKGFHAVFPPMT